MGVFNLKTTQELANLVELNRLSQFEKTNKIVIDCVKEGINMFDYQYKFLYNDKKPTLNFLKMFDEFNDNKASVRILNYLEK